jgi:hypothetical protein
VVAPVIAAAIPSIIAIIDKLIPDADEANRAKLKLIEMEQAGELQLALGQQDINRIEAASSDYKVAGWRPAAGWVSVAGLAYNALFQPLLAWAGALWDFPAPPAANEELLLFVLGSLLGVAGLRSLDKIKGVAR